MKNQQREIMRQLRSTLTFAEVEQFSQQIFESLKCIISTRKEKDYFVYNSFGNEVSTNQIIEYLLKHNKNVFLPRVENDDMVAVKINANTQYLISKFGIREPIGKSTDINNFIAIMPCLAIDKSGNRLGYGGGYYDRFLANKKAYKIAVCFDFQLIEKIDADVYDIPCDMAVTNKGKIYF